jgi:hypothetical protein
MALMAMKLCMKSAIAMALSGGIATARIRLA